MLGLGALGSALTFGAGGKKEGSKGPGGLMAQKMADYKAGQAPGAVGVDPRVPVAGVEANGQQQSNQAFPTRQGQQSAQAPYFQPQGPPMNAASGAQNAPQQPVQPAGSPVAQLPGSAPPMNASGAGMPSPSPLATGGAAGLASQLVGQLGNVSKPDVTGRIEGAKESLNVQRKNAMLAMQDNAAARGVSGGNVEARTNDINDNFGRDFTTAKRDLTAQGDDEYFQRLMGASNAATGLAGQELSGELGRGNLALQGELGRGNLALGKGQLSLSGELGRGGLDLQNRQFVEDIRQYDQNYGASQSQASSSNSARDRAQTFQEAQAAYQAQQDYLDRMGR